MDADGVIPHPPHPDNTRVGTAYRPDALGIAVRHAWETTGLPILVTENGIATGDDDRRIAYTGEALQHLHATIDDGADVRGYLPGEDGGHGAHGSRGEADGAAVATRAVRMRSGFTHTVPSGRRSRWNKVPEVTAYFWIIKVLCTTVGQHQPRQDHVPHTHKE
ncbi:family 1 glycosylhydrolase [Streptomyces sp. NPDC086033]|uniref:family 1 glycosylhydrolase n=1 Tax=Streptomyces sp. NPDC086033 TaxID=3365747 RepID=UPI0037D79631